MIFGLSTRGFVGFSTACAEKNSHVNICRGEKLGKSAKPRFLLLCISILFLSPGDPKNGYCGIMCHFFGLLLDQKIEKQDF